MLIYIGIDDTDNLNTKGTGFRARSLAAQLAEQGWGEIMGISRHQLFVDPAIPFTSHNSSLCIGLEAVKDDMEELIRLCSEYLERESAEGSDPGLCIAVKEQVSKALVGFGRRAKCEVLKKQESYELAQSHGIHLSAHGGTGDGVIGALAGVALRAEGDDGRFVWVRGIREMEGVFTCEEILSKTGVLSIRTETGEIPSEGDSVDVGDWFRPVLLEGKPTLLVEKTDSAEVRWRILDRKRIKEKY